MKITVSNLFNNFFVSGDSKQIKKFPQKSGTLTTTGEGGGIVHFVVGTTKKYHFFYAAPNHLNVNRHYKVCPILFVPVQFDINRMIRQGLWNTL